LSDHPVPRAELLIRPVNTLLVFTGRRPGRYTLRPQLTRLVAAPGHPCPGLTRPIFIGRVNRSSLRTAACLARAIDNKYQESHLRCCWRRCSLANAGTPDGFLGRNHRRGAEYSGLFANTVHQVCRGSQWRINADNFARPGPRDTQKPMKRLYGALIECLRSEKRPWLAFADGCAQLPPITGPYPCLISLHPTRKHLDLKTVLRQ
jgi:hypothetical protein